MKIWKGRPLCTKMVIPWLTSAFVTFCLVGQPWWPVTAWGQKAPDDKGKVVQSAESQKKSPLAAELEDCRNKRCLVLGPITLISYDGRSLGLSESSGNIIVDLQNKKFTVKDGNGRPISVDTIRRGGKVFVCSGQNEVVVYVPEKKEGTTNVAH